MKSLWYRFLRWIAYFLTNPDDYKAGAILDEVTANRSKRASRKVTRGFKWE